MPNHVTHRLHITGPVEERKRFLTECFNEEGDLDFEKLVPMPACIKGTLSGSDADLGIEAVTQAPRHTCIGVLTYLNYPWVKELGITDFPGLLRYVVKERPEALIEAGKCLVARKQTGHDNWHDWSCANWGTKWNAYSCRVTENEDHIELMFDTAWSSPEPIFEKIAERYPALVITGAAFDEGGGFAVTICCINGARHYWSCLR